MSALQHVGTVSGLPFGQPIASVALAVSGPGATPSVRIFNFDDASRSSLGIAEGALAQVTQQSGQSLPRTALTVGGDPGSVPDDILAVIEARGFANSLSAFLGPIADYGQRVELVCAPLGRQAWLYAAARTGSGIDIFRPGPGGMIFQSHLADTPESYAAGISAMLTVQIGARSFLFAASEVEHGLTGYEIGASGGLLPTASMGTGQLVPVQNVSELLSVATDGVTYLVAAASGSSSLTVFAVAGDGTLSVTDHLVDDLGTRFQNVTVMDALEIDGRVFVVVAGADDGISLLTMIPGGQLIHLQSLADTATTALAAVTGIEMVAVGDEIQMFFTSAQEAGLSQFRMDVGALGLTARGTGATLAGTGADDMLVASSGGATVSGGAGADILVDGTGSDTLWGGTGSDIFVLTGDGLGDVIGDFQPGIDRIDLSLLPGLRNLQQLIFTPVSGGVTIRYGAEFMTVLTASGQWLSAADFQISSLINVTRFAVEAGVPDMPAPDPEPNPPPTPAGYIVVSGTAAANALRGTPANEQMLGLAGDDILTGGGGQDQFVGGSGFDVVSYAGADAPVRIGLTASLPGIGPGQTPAFHGVEGLIGTDLNDSLGGDSGGNLLDGAGGNDLAYGGSGDDTLYGGWGSDTLTGGTGDDSVFGGSWGDLLGGDGGNDLVNGQDGDDRVYGGWGSDTLQGGNGNDSLYGGTWGDLLGGEGGNDLVYGQDGHDRLYGSWGSDTLLGGTGNDSLYGGTWGDVLGGDAGNDFLNGQGGHDRLYGGAGADTLYGGNGNDTLVGGAGPDRMSGNAGADVFVFRSQAEVGLGGARDVIADFTGGQDMMDFSAMGMSFSGASGFTSTAGEMIALASGGDTILAGDIDGDGVADFEVMLLGVTSVTGAMFV